MKKFLSIIIAMLLIVSFSATTAVAFADGETATYKVTYEAGEHGEGTAPAEQTYAANASITLASATAFTPKKGYEFAGWIVTDQADVLAAGDKFNMPAKDVTVTAQWTPAHTVTVDNAKLMEWLRKDEGFANLKLEMGDVKLGEELMKSAANLEEVFDGIKYVDEDTDTAKKSNNDKIYVEYCRPSESPKGQETWQNSTLISNNIRLSSSGWYAFRIVVKDSTSVNVLATSEKFTRYAEDTSNPVVSLSTAMKDKITSGLTEGTKYTVSTSLTITDSSSTTVTYKIFKKVNGDWTLVYDSTTKEVTEGYEKVIGTDGSITPAKEDVSTEPVYRITYEVVDANGYTAVSSAEGNVPFSDPMDLFVNAAVVEDNVKISPVEIVLFSIAGAAAIGIVVLLLIKPKQPAPARATANDDGAAETPEE